MKASIVIGLGYGDEGKGITTDYLSSLEPDKPTIVVRFSGGQQAGHTVIKDGIKHIHSSFGAGSLRGLPTYFTEHTTFYPLSAYNEYKMLEDKGFSPSLILHPLTKITTPFDVWANQSSLTNLTHGTCGLGVGKTMERNEGPCKLYAIDLLNTNLLLLKLKIIAEYYQLDIHNLSSGLKEVYTSFLESVVNLSFTVATYEYLKNYQHLIFEGSQGILLDMDHGVFPHVTYSNTTSKNAMEVINKLNILDIDAYYITRTYATRHGNGPFIEEEVILKNNEEEINTLNRWQGKFKLANLDYELLQHAINIDDVYLSEKASKNLVITCNDQLDTFDVGYFVSQFNAIYKSYSPESKSMQRIM